MMERSEIEALAAWDQFRRVAQGASLATALAGTGAIQATCVAVRVMEPEREVSPWPRARVEAVVLRRAAVRATARGYVALQVMDSAQWDLEWSASQASEDARELAAARESARDSQGAAASESPEAPAPPRR